MEKLVLFKSVLANRALALEITKTKKVLKR